MVSVRCGLCGQRETLPEASADLPSLSCSRTRKSSAVALPWSRTLTSPATRQRVRVGVDFSSHLGTISQPSEHPDMDHSADAGLGPDSGPKWTRVCTSPLSACGTLVP